MRKILMLGVALLCLTALGAGQNPPPKPKAAPAAKAEPAAKASAAPAPPTTSTAPAAPAAKAAPRPAVPSPLDMPMIRVEGGVYYMGCSAEQGELGKECAEDENPQREVTLGAFEIGKYEVTQGLWKAVMRYNSSRFKGDDLPVENVAWDEVQTFLRKLNALTGKSYRLPTEAEWEYAARGGVASKSYKYSGGDELGEVGWYAGNSGKSTHAAGSAERANELGIHDMSGNVWEWCQDWYGAYPKAAASNPRGVPPASYRVLRGGAWDSVEDKCRTSTRYFAAPGTPQAFIGFRLARTLP